MPDIHAVIDGFRQTLDGRQILGKVFPSPIDPGHHGLGRDVLDRRQAAGKPFPVLGLQGASAKPQLPMITLVTPCQHEQLPSGSQLTCASMCVCPSIKPGATIIPSASMTRSAGVRMRPISATRPALTPTSAR